VSASSVFVTTFLAAAVEVIEMVIIVVGVGSVRGWRSTWLGAGAGLAVLALLVGAFGTALRVVPIGGLRLVVGSLLLVFGLQWLRKGMGRPRRSWWSRARAWLPAARCRGFRAARCSCWWDAAVQLWDVLGGGGTGGRVAGQ